MCQQVARYVSEEAKTGGSIVATGVQTECSTVDIISRLLQTFEVREEFTLKVDGEQSTYQRLSHLNSGILLSNVEWL